MGSLRSTYFEWSKKIPNSRRTRWCRRDRWTTGPILRKTTLWSSNSSKNTKPFNLITTRGPWVSTLKHSKLQRNTGCSRWKSRKRNWQRGNCSKISLIVWIIIGKSMGLAMDIGMIVILVLKLETIRTERLHRRARLEDRIVLLIHSSMAASTPVADSVLCNKTQIIGLTVFQNNNQTNWG